MRNFFGNYLPKEENKAETEEFTVLSNGIQMPVIGLGVMHIHGNECVRAICETVDTGYRMIDMAAIRKMEGGRELFFEHDSPEFARMFGN